MGIFILLTSKMSGFESDVMWEDLITWWWYTLSVDLSDIYTIDIPTTVHVLHETGT